MNNSINEKDLESVTGGKSTNWFIVSDYIQEHAHEDPQYELLKPDLTELAGFVHPLQIQDWVYDHFFFAVVQDALRK